MELGIIDANYVNMAVSSCSMQMTTLNQPIAQFSIGGTALTGLASSTAVSGILMLAI